jgi:hypothetical protein
VLSTGASVSFTLSIFHLFSLSADEVHFSAQMLFTARFCQLYLSFPFGEALSLLC